MSHGLGQLHYTPQSTEHALRVEDSFAERTRQSIEGFRCCSFSLVVGEAVSCRLILDYYWYCWVYIFMFIISTLVDTCGILLLPLGLVSKPVDKAVNPKPRNVNPVMLLLSATRLHMTSLT